MSKIIEYKLNEINQISKKILKIIFKNKINLIALNGNLGAGKTRLISEILKLLSIQEPVLSPTYTYFNSYNSKKNNLIIYHFDLYRLNSTQDFYSFGFNEYLYQKNSLCFIEWPELLLSELKTNYLKLELKYLNQESRELNISIK